MELPAIPSVDGRFMKKRHSSKWWYSIFSTASGLNAAPKMTQHLFNSFRSQCSSGNDTASFQQLPVLMQLQEVTRHFSSASSDEKKFSQVSGHHIISLINQLIYRTTDQGTVPFHMFPEVRQTFSSVPYVYRYIQYLLTYKCNKDDFHCSEFFYSSRI